jgi:uncharacterized protein
MELSDLAGEKYVSLTTYRKSGESSARPVWIAGIDGGRIGFTTDADSLKVRRIRNDGRVLVQPCDGRGNLRAGTSPVEGRAVIAAEGEPDAVKVRASIAKKYGWQYRALRLAGSARRLVGKPAMPGCAVVIAIPDGAGA